jgi:hypothetical protein
LQKIPAGAGNQSVETCSGLKNEGKISEFLMISVRRLIYFMILFE